MCHTHRCPWSSGGGGVQVQQAGPWVSPVAPVTGTSVTICTGSKADGRERGEESVQALPLGGASGESQADGQGRLSPSAQGRPGRGGHPWEVLRVARSGGREGRTDGSLRFTLRPRGIVRTERFAKSDRPGFGGWPVP